MSAQTPGATPMELDFSEVAESIVRRVDRRGRPLDRLGRLATYEQEQKRMRRNARHALRVGAARVDEGLEVMHKPLEEWDLEELARGRPRAVDGTFKGKSPAFITRAVHEAAIERFKLAMKSTLNAKAIDAMVVLDNILSNDEVDNRGKPAIPPTVKLQAAQFLVEHLLGKPKQPIEQDISVKLQGVLSMAMVAPNDAGDLMLAQYGRRGDVELPRELTGFIDVDIIDDDEDEGDGGE